MKKVFSYRGIKILEQTWKAPEVKQLPPVVILAGYLHRAEMLQEFVTYLSRFSSVTVLELPGWGENQPATVNDVECADLLANYFKERGLKGANLISFGDSTAAAYFFAYMYPRYINRLVLHGAAARLRDSVRTLFKGIGNSIEEANRGRFLTGMQMGLMNYSKRQQIPSYKKTHFLLEDLLLQEVKNYSAEDNVKHLSRYIDRDDLPDGMKVPTLLIASEFDPFTSVHDHFLVMKRCMHAQMVVVTECDHLAIFEKPKELQLAALSFLVRGKVATSSSLRLHNEDEIPGYQRQIYPRIYLDEIGFLEGVESGLAPIPINVKDINVYGCKLFTMFSKHQIFNQKKIALRLRTIGVEDFKLDLSFFARNRGTYKAVFHHYNTDITESLERLLEAHRQERIKKHSLISG